MSMTFLSLFVVRLECASPDLFSTDRASENLSDLALCPSDTANRTPVVRGRADKCPGAEGQKRSGEGQGEGPDLIPSPREAGRALGRGVRRPRSGNEKLERGSKSSALTAHAT